MLLSCNEELVVVCAATLLAVAAQGQVFQFTRERMIEYTEDNPFDLFEGV